MTSSNDSETVVQEFLKIKCLRIQCVNKHYLLSPSSLLLFLPPFLLLSTLCGYVNIVGIWKQVLKIPRKRHDLENMEEIRTVCLSTEEDG
jgi:hypothetical protein